jgi:hypothetical protein
MPDTGIHEIVRIAFAALAEMEIVTCDDMMNTQPLAQGSGDEVFGALGRKCLVETLLDNRIEAQMTENHSLHWSRGQAKHRLVRPEHGARMGLKTQDD